MKLFISSSKEIMYYITHKRHGVFCSWKSIFICKFYRNKVVRSTEHSWPTREVSANWGFTCSYRSVMTACSQENLNYRSHAADVESLDNLIAIVCRGRNAAVGWQLFLSSKTFLNLGFAGVREEPSPSHLHTVMSQYNWGFRKLFYKIVVLLLQALAQDRHLLFGTSLAQKYFYQEIRWILKERWNHPTLVVPLRTSFHVRSYSWTQTSFAEEGSGRAED